MKEPEVKHRKRRRNPPPITSNGQPLLKLLVAQATVRGQTLASLAKTLGVTYERLAQWRRGDALMANASKDVVLRAAQFLGLPPVLVLMFSGAIRLDDFVWPSKVSLDERLTIEMERMKQNPYVGPFVPGELLSADPAVKLFIAFLFNELNPTMGVQKPDSRWMNTLHQAFTAVPVIPTESVKTTRPVDEDKGIF
jgi:transcriptional regulator with XRE-family HTH domain